MHHYITYDIETVANDRAKDYYAQKEYSAPANYKDPEKIKAAVEESRAKDRERSALYWWTGKVICIGTIDSDEHTIFIDRTSNEKELLTNFANYLDNLKPTAVLVGKSSEDFDRPFLIGRYLANSLPVPSLLKESRSIRDVDHIFSYSRSCSQVSKLSDYAWGLGIEGKTGHGSQVQAMYEKGEFDEIASYCLNDNRIVAEMIGRYNK